jgi:transcriptional regulator with XRE-family HTH domain
MEIESKWLGERLFKLRKERKQTQTELAKKSGVNLRTIVEIEKGMANPRIHTVAKLAKAFGQDTYVLLMKPYLPTQPDWARKNKEEQTTN